MRWSDFSDEALKDLKSRIRAGRDGLHWIEEIAEELARRAQSEALEKLKRRNGNPRTKIREFISLFIEGLLRTHSSLHPCGFLSRFDYCKDTLDLLTSERKQLFSEECLEKAHQKNTKNG